jgi:hypothetical protein
VVLSLVSRLSHSFCTSRLFKGMGDSVLPLKMVKYTTSDFSVNKFFPQNASM